MALSAVYQGSSMKGATTVVLTVVMGGSILLWGSCGKTGDKEGAMKLNPPEGCPMTQKITKTDQEWQQRLTPEQYEVARKKGTERAFTGEYYACKTPGIYQCACCGNELFSSETKFDSGTGWPSYWAPVSETNVESHVDNSHGMRRVEVVCSRCGAHLGHLFDDGPKPTHLRYCINSASLKLVEKK
jgi:peptide-methionine (R)-S-oxide reductase